MHKVFCSGFSTYGIPPFEIHACCIFLIQPFMKFKNFSAKNTNMMMTESKRLMHSQKQFTNTHLTWACPGIAVGWRLTKTDFPNHDVHIQSPSFLTQNRTPWFTLNDGTLNSSEIRAGEFFAKTLPFFRTMETKCIYPDDDQSLGVSFNATKIEVIFAWTTH